MTKEHETLQATFQRLEIQGMSRNLCADKQEPAKEDLGLCGYAKKDPTLIIGRLCELQGRTYCENFGKPELVTCCPALKKHGLLEQKL